MTLVPILGISGETMVAISSGLVATPCFHTIWPTNLPKSITYIDFAVLIEIPIAMHSSNHSCKCCACFSIVLKTAKITHPKITPLYDEETFGVYWSLIYECFWVNCTTQRAYVCVQKFPNMMWKQSANGVVGMLKFDCIQKNLSMKE